MKILVIEDEPLASDLLCNQLKSLGHQTTQIYLGEGIKDIQKLRDYSLAIIDQNLGAAGWTGIQTGIKLKKMAQEIDHKIKLVMLTAETINALDEIAFSRDFEGFLKKPINIDHLKKALILSPTPSGLITPPILELKDIADLLNNIQLPSKLGASAKADMILVENAYVDLVKRINALNLL